MHLSFRAHSSAPKVAIGTTIDQKIIQHEKMVRPFFLIPRPDTAFSALQALDNLSYTPVESSSIVLNVHSDMVVVVLFRDPLITQEKASVSSVSSIFPSLLTKNKDSTPFGVEVIAPGSSVGVYYVHGSVQFVFT